MKGLSVLKPVFVGKNIKEPVIKYRQSEKQASLRCRASLQCQKRSHVFNEKHLKHQQMEVEFINTINADIKIDELNT